ncbi:MAG TPA: hypothetical protein VJG90_03025 [Candidatus Nanoarchaeia archaeon]|nr:hypothetical protein [Candidatus Nanoarchaeia archaeon]
MPKLKVLIEDDELDTSFLESEEYARKSREVLKKTYGMVKGWKRTGQEIADLCRKGSW